MEKSAKLCVLCCTSFIPPAVDVEGTEEGDENNSRLDQLMQFCQLLLMEEGDQGGDKVEWSQRLEKLVLKETLKNFKQFLEARKVSVCQVCGGGVEGALESRQRAEEMQKEVKRVQKMLMELTMGLGVEMERFFGRMKKIEGVIRGSRGRGMRRHLGKVFGGDVEEDGRKIDLVRGRILDVVKNLQDGRLVPTQEILLEDEETANYSVKMEVDQEEDFGGDVEVPLENEGESSNLQIAQVWGSVGNVVSGGGDEDDPGSGSSLMETPTVTVEVGEGTKALRRTRARALRRNKSQLPLRRMTVYRAERDKVIITGAKGAPKMVPGSSTFASSSGTPTASNKRPRNEVLEGMSMFKKWFVSRALAQNEVVTLKPEALQSMKYSTEEDKLFVQRTGILIKDTTRSLVCGTCGFSARSRNVEDTSSWPALERVITHHVNVSHGNGKKLTVKGRKRRKSLAVDRKFKCSLCKYLFTTQSSLNRHSKKYCPGKIENSSKNPEN